MDGSDNLRQAKERVLERIALGVALATLAALPGAGGGHPAQETEMTGAIP